MSEQPDDTTDERTVTEIMWSDDCVRSVRNPDGRLVAYRDGDAHVVISRGNEPRTRWTKRVPAERTDVESGDHLWTIPDNWECAARESRDHIAYGIYSINGTDNMVKLSIPTNNHLVDKWYAVKAVGRDLAAEADGTLGVAPDVRALADTLETEDMDYRDDPEALRRVADKWDAVVTDLGKAEHWAADEAMEEGRTADQPLQLNDWTIEFQLPIFRPAEVIDREIDLSDLDTDEGLLLDLLRSRALLPSRYKFRVSLE
jgi:hypothetical protein